MGVLMCRSPKELVLLLQLVDEGTGRDGTLIQRIVRNVKEQ